MTAILYKSFEKVKGSALLLKSRRIKTRDEIHNSDDDKTPLLYASLITLAACCCCQ